MRRKVIQIAGSTQLVSLPRPWAKRNNIQRGQEVEVTEDGDRVIISSDAKEEFKSKVLDISNLGEMTHRIIGAHYRGGIDELRIKYNDPTFADIIHEFFAKDTTTGIEIISQTSSGCVLRNVAGTLEEFDSVMRRVFLLLVNMADETTDHLKKKKFDEIQNIAILERTNNRLTSICRRILNKTPASVQTNKIGPLYTIVEMLENLADEYKYISYHFANLQNKNVKVHPEAIKLFETASKMVRIYYETYYKFDVNKMNQLKDFRNKVVDGSHKLIKMKIGSTDFWLLHHAMSIATLILSMTGPYLVVYSDSPIE